MKVIHISSAKTWRGGERQLDFLIDGMIERGITCYLMYITESPLDKRCGSKVEDRLTFKKGPFALLRNAKNLVAFCKNNQIDYVHAHDSHSHSVIWFASLFFGLQCKGIVHRRLDNPVKLLSLKKYNHPSISKIICVSEKVKSILQPSISQPVKLVVIRSGIDINRIQAPRMIAKEPYSIIYIAAFTKEKGHDVFLKIAKEITDVLGSSAIKFVLLGDGPLLEQYRESYGEHQNIHFEGFVNDVYPYLSDADLLLHTSRQESLGSSLLDGMLYGLPCVAFDVGGISEVIKDGYNGLLLEKNLSENEVAKSIVQLLKNEELYHDMSTNSLSTAASFSKEEMVNATVKIYDELGAKN